MVNYVVGFLFNPDKTHVVLIEKNRPDWQKGLLNGVGGHVNEQEQVDNAMCREFEEEAGLLVPLSHWEMFAIGTRFDHQVAVYFFKAFDELLGKIESKTDEPVYIIPIKELKDYNKVYNLNWLIPLALDSKTTITNFIFDLNK